MTKTELLKIYYALRCVFGTKEANRILENLIKTIGS